MLELRYSPQQTAQSLRPLLLHGYDLGTAGSPGVIKVGVRENLRAFQTFTNKYANFIRTESSFINTHVCHVSRH